MEVSRGKVPHELVVTSPPAELVSDLESRGGSGMQGQSLLAGKVQCGATAKKIAEMPAKIHRPPGTSRARPAASFISG